CSNIFAPGATGDAAERVLGRVAGAAIDSVVERLTRQFRDQSGRLTNALRSANVRAWQTLEVALAGDSFWDRCKGLRAAGEDKRFKQEMQAHLKTLTFPEGDADKFRRLCRSELRAARKAGLLDADKLDPEQLANRAGALARFGDPTALLAAEGNLIAQI